MAVSPLPQWFEGSEYTHKVAVCVMKYGPISRITLAQILDFRKARFPVLPAI